MREWLAEYGIDMSADDADVEREVARRRGKLFAVILVKCHDAHARGHPSAANFNDCLEHSAAVERRLGNRLD
jgi:hypothetical protein